MPAPPGWQVPLEAPIKLERPFYRPSSDYGAGHRGVDYRVSLGQAIMAPAAGVVSFTGHVVNRSVLSIKHLDGSISEFEPACALAAEGEQVKQAQVIAKVCDADLDYSQHCQNLRCLHVSLRTEAGYLSPLVRTGQLSPSRLLPWPKELDH